MQTKIIERYFFFGLLLATFVFTFYIFRPFWAVLVLSISFSIVLYPVYRALRNFKLPSWLSSLLTVLIFAIILFGPISAVAILIFDQSQDVYQKVVSEQSVGSFFDSLEATINGALPEGMALDLKDKISDFTLFISQNVANIFSATLSAIFGLVLIFLSIFYFLKDGSKWRQALIDLSPLADTDDQKIIRRLDTAVNGVLKGYFLIAIVQGILMGVGFWIFGIPNGALWGTVAAIASLVPMVGTAFVSVPAMIFLFATGHTGAAIGFLVWSVVVVGMVDNFLNPLFIGSKINIPPLFILFAVLGGISVLGPIGVLVGPLAISLLYTLISIYKTEYRNQALPLP